MDDPRDPSSPAPRGRHQGDEGSRSRVNPMERRRALGGEVRERNAAKWKESGRLKPSVVSGRANGRAQLPRIAK